MLCGTQRALQGAEGSQGTWEHCGRFRVRAYHYWRLSSTMGARRHCARLRDLQVAGGLLYIIHFCFSAGS